MVNYLKFAGLLLLPLCFVLFFQFAGSRFTLYSEPDLPKFSLLLGAVFTFLVARSGKSLFSWPLVLFCALVIGTSFLSYSNGRILFSDDHPSFLYRFYLLKEHFPNIPFYNPQWNAGYSAREFLPSGMLNSFFLASPIIYLADFGDLGAGYRGIAAYNLILVWLFLLLAPAVVWISARLLEMDRQAATIAALLSFAPSLSYFEWLLKYGTLGFIVSSVCVPLTFALIHRLIFADRKAGWADVFYLLIGSFFAISWALTGFIFLPLVLLGLLKIIANIDFSRLKLSLVFVVLFAICNGPWIKIFIEESKVFSFVSGSEMPGVAKSEPLKKTAPVAQENAERWYSSILPAEVSASRLNKAEAHFEENLRKLNPLLIIFFLPGLFLLKGWWLKVTFISVCSWLLAISFFGTVLKPQLELSRMVLPLGILFVFPVSVFFSSLLDFAAPALRVKGLLKVVGIGSVWLLSGLILTHPLVALANWTNRSAEKYVLEPEEFRGLSRSIVEHAGEGRVFFLGFVLHELGSTHGISQDGGHIAPLPAITGVPMYASDFYHAKWSTSDPIPKRFRDLGSEGVEEFLDLVNVSSVATARKEWVDYCRKDPRYQEVYSGKHFTLFTRASESISWFLEGDGEIEHLPDGIRVKPFTPEVVLKFRRLPKLISSDPGVAIFSHPAFSEDFGKSETREVDFIGLRFFEGNDREDFSVDLTY